MIAKPVFRTEAKPCCLVCGAPGKPRYDNIPDLLLGIPGLWRVVRCAEPNCNTHWLDPAPREADLALAYQNYMTHQAGTPLGARQSWRKRAYGVIQHRRLGYPAQSNFLSKLLGSLLSISPRHRAMAQRELLYVPHKLNGKLLEIGCGNGRYLERLRAAGWSCIGVDFDEKATAMARQLGLEVHTGNLASQKFQSSSFDTIVMSHVIEHVPDPAEVLALCHRLLRPGGQIVLLTPNVNSFGHRMAGRHWINLDPPRHLNLFTPASMTRLLASVGFKHIRVDTPSEMAPGFIAADEQRKVAELLGTTAPLAGNRFSVRTLVLALIELVAVECGSPVGEELLARADRQ